MDKIKTTRWLAGFWFSFVLAYADSMFYMDGTQDEQNKTASNVISPPKFKYKPSWPYSNYYDEFGPPISVSCDLVSENGTTLLWLMDNNPVMPSPTLVINNNNQTLTLTYPTRNQTGSYKCMAYNSAGSINYTGYIFISVRRQETRPRVVLTDPDSQVRHARVGDNVTISCTFDIGGSTTGLLDFNMDWHKDLQSVNDTNHTTWGLNETQSNDQILSLTFHAFKASDYGSYRCIGVNHIGNDSRIVSVVPPVISTGKFPVTIVIVVSISSTVLILTFIVASILVHRYRRNRKYQTLEWEEPEDGKYHVPNYKLKYDVFVSYSHEDLLWVKDVLFKSLLERGYEVCLDFKDFVPGMATSENIIDAIYTSRKTIVLMSKHFLKSTWGQFELQQAHFRAISQRKDVLILVKFDECKVPTKLMGKTFLDWSDVMVRPHFWDRMYEALGDPGDFGTPDEQLLTDNVTLETDTIEQGELRNPGEPPIIDDMTVDIDTHDSGNFGNSDETLLIDVTLNKNIHDPGTVTGSNGAPVTGMIKVRSGNDTHDARQRFCDSDEPLLTGVTLDNNVNESGNFRYCDEQLLTDNNVTLENDTHDPGIVNADEALLTDVTLGNDAHRPLKFKTSGGTFKQDSHDSGNFENSDEHVLTDIALENDTRKP